MAQAMKQEKFTGDVTLTPGEAKEMIIGIYKSGRFTRTNLLRGAPGIGKTSITRQAAEELAKDFPGFNYVEINPTMPADEVCGLPDLIRVEGQDTVTDYALPVWFPTAKDNPDWKGIICLDDALQGDRMMQQTLANLIHARNLRGHALPEGAMIIATGNRIEDKAGVTKTLTHFADRMDEINVEADPEAWLDDFAIPKGVDPRVVGYIHMFKDKLNAFNPNGAKGPTSRGWEAVSDTLYYLDTIKGSPIRNKLAQAKLAGAIGIGEATSFWAFCTKFNELPNLDDILQDPEGHTTDYKLDIKYTIALAFAGMVDNKTLGPALTYVDRLGADIVVLMMKLAVKRSPALNKAKAWIDWMVAHQKDIIATNSGPSR